MSEAIFYLFGGHKEEEGKRPWNEHVWSSSDDRVRGGESQSYFVCSADSTVASFRGRLDIAALGGAGFASQRTDGLQCWNLLDFQGLALGVAHSDGKKYTVVVKDEIPSKRPDGGEESTVSWEYDFVPSDAQVTTLFWGDLEPTYRGRPCPNAEPLRLNQIKRIGIMIRRFVLCP